MIRLESIAVRQGRFRLEGIHLHVEPGQYAVLMGSTGCGKSTIIELICGLRRPHRGTIHLAGRPVVDLTPGRPRVFIRPASRGVGYVPQDGALFASMPVRDQLAFALTLRAWPRRDRLARVAQLADELGIAHLLDRTPERLSGGERQRVALGRALAFRPSVVCLDEPLSALDEPTRADMCRVIEDACHAERVTALHVTHSTAEARRLADRVFRLRDGQIAELDPTDLPIITLGERRATSPPPLVEETR